ncbi:MAG TPA: winged helix-turn-helix transcriptional regulator [Candidatus Paceibacterota bacterium]|nr:winged helix-turn-helix transcriptional regulator [Candidatus Paceibacterota bacterium]
MKPTHTTCPISKTATLLSDTWTMLIVRALLESKEAMRFCDLERELDGISTRTLTLKLKKLEEEKMVKRTRNGQYQPTRKGEGLRIVERAMRRYGEKYL